MAQLPEFELFTHFSRNNWGYCAYLKRGMHQLRTCARDPKAEGRVLDDVTDSLSQPVGDPKTEQFLKLLGAHERSLFAYVYAIAPNWQDAEEIMQRVRIRIWQQFAQYDESRDFNAWARAIAYYLVLAHRKEKGRQRERFGQALIDAISDQFEEHLEQASDRRKVLIGCLEKLDSKRRNLVTEYYSTAREASESIAAKLSLTPNALRQSIFRIRKVLLDCVERTLRAESRS
jgi:RNA polymerase sigma-70 factor, ECF subfamily